MKIGLLVTNYNTWELTTQCIENCLLYANEKIDQFVIVDDCSTQVFENQFKETTLLKNHKNLGLIKSLNRGISQLETDLIVLFDSDAWPLENFVKETKEYFNNNPNIGVATFQTVNDSGKPSASYETEPGIISLILGQYLYRHYHDIFLLKRKNISVFTCAMVIRSKVLEQIGLFDEKFDWLELDHDFCMRATRKGWKVGVMPIRALHKGSGTPQKMSHRVIRFYKNRWYLLKKYNKIRFPIPCASLICARLAMEYLLIWTIGPLYYRNLDVVNDKAFSRSFLFKYLMRNP